MVRSPRASLIALIIAIAIIVGGRAATAETFANPEQGIGVPQRFDAAHTSVVESSAATTGALATATDTGKNGWDVVIESLFLWRDNHTPSRIAGDFDVGVGPRIIATREVDDGMTWETEYFGVFGMNANAAESSNDGISSSGGGIPGSPLALPAQFVAQYRYESNLASFEFNVVRKRSSLSILAGFRYLRLEEIYRTRAELSSGLDLIPINPSGPPLYPINAPFEMVRTTFTDKDCADNYLLGGQLGLRWRRDNNLWFYEATGKAGVFGNVYRITGEPVMSQPAFIGDLNFSAGLHLTDIWSVRAGYNLLWINEVALAPHQIWATPQRISFDPDDRIFLQGANVGLEATW